MSAANPVIGITRGQPGPAELAAVVAALLAAATEAAASGSAAHEGQRVTPAWAARSRARAPMTRPGRNAWRMSGWAGGTSHG